MNKKTWEINVPFLPNLFRTQKSKERIATNYWLNYKFQKAVQITDSVDYPVKPEIMKKQLQKLSKLQKIPGKFIGVNGWFLPDREQVLREVLDTVETSPMNLSKLQEKVGLDEKHSLIALKEYLKEIKSGELIFYKEEIISIKYLQEQWREALGNFDLGDLTLVTTFEEVFNSLKYKDALSELIEEWITEPNSSVVRNIDGRIILREFLPTLIVEETAKIWEAGATQLSFRDLAKHFGINSNEVMEIVLELINKNRLKDVTIYATDELIKRRTKL